MTPVSFTYQYPHPAVTVDCAVFGFDGDVLKLLLIQRRIEPYQGKWALPGGFVGIDESVDAAAKRELREETGIAEAYLEQLYTFGAPNRDPRERVISVAHYALVRSSAFVLQADTDAAQAAWFPIADLPALAFDHEQIVAAALQRLKAKVRYEPIGFELLPENFTLGQLQRLYEAVLGTAIDKRNFRKKILSTKIIDPLNQFQRGVAHRAAQYFRFNRTRYEQLKRRGFNFEI